MFFLLLTGISAGLKVLGGCLFFVVWLLIKRKNTKDMQNTLSVSNHILTGLPRRKENQFNLFEDLMKQI